MRYTVPIVTVHLLALLVFVPAFFSWTGVILCVAGVHVFGQTITMGYHRLLAHRSFDTPRWFEHTLVLGALAMTVFVGILGFLPLYLVNVHGLSSQMMGVIMTAIGGVAIVYGLIGPMLSDRIGRKPTIIGGFLFSMLGFATIALSGGSFTMLLVGAMLSVAGNAGAGILIMVVIPGESAPSHLSATAMGFNSAVGELLGAGVMPVAIGITADQIGLETLPWFLATAALILCAVAFGLRETAPRVVARAGAA